jgi:hypothetical protein
MLIALLAVLAQDELALGESTWRPVAAAVEEPAPPAGMEPFEIRAWDSIVPDEAQTAAAWREWMSEVDAEPELPLVLRIGLSPINFIVEGTAWLLFPRRILVNGIVLFDQDASSEDFATIFWRELMRREMSFLAGLAHTVVATTNVELGIEEPDKHRFDKLQSRVPFDALKKAWRERFAIPKLELETVVEAVKTGEIIDVVLVPAAISAYAMRFGIEKKWRLGEDVRVAVSVERGTRIYKVATQDTYRRVASLSVNFLDLPVSLIFSIYGGTSGFDFGFIGIGTDLGAVIEAINGKNGR